VAIQSGRHAAYRITRTLHGDQRVKPFRYFDKGSMATISRFSAVATVGRLRVSGFLGWLLWLAVHLLYLVGFKNRLTALLHWFVSFLGRARSERTVTVQQVIARAALHPTRLAAAGVSSNETTRSRTQTVVSRQGAALTTLDPVAVADRPRRPLRGRFRGRFRGRSVRAGGVAGG
jgi:NADH dehydrogenase